MQVICINSKMQMRKKKKLTTNEKFLISFVIVLVLAIAFNWKNFFDKLKTTFDKYQQTETTTE